MKKSSRFIKSLLSTLLVTAMVISNSTFVVFGKTSDTISLLEPSEELTTATFYNNATIESADPHVLYDKASGYYYAYTTAGAKGDNRFGIYRSADLATWEQLDGAIPKNDPNQWADDWFWAPECYYNENNGYYYLFYSGRMTNPTNAKEHFGFEDFEEACKTGVAVSKSPAGPFYNITKSPIDYFPYDPNYHDVNTIMENQNKAPATLEEGEKADLGVYLPFIDANVFFDDNGDIFMYYSRNAYRNWVWDKNLDPARYIEESNIYAVQLKTDWWTTKGEPIMPTIVDASKKTTEDKRTDGFTAVINYGNDPQDWENGHVSDFAKYEGNKKNRRWAEGSFTMKYYFDTNGDGIKDPIYYIVYSCNNHENELYGEGYAVSESPLGPWKKFGKNPIVKQDESTPVYGTGHGSFITSPDGSEVFHIYHGKTDKTGARMMYTDKTIFDENDLDSSILLGKSVPKLKVEQIKADQEIPSGVAPYKFVFAKDEYISTDNKTIDIDWAVANADGGKLALSNPLNRVVVVVSDEEIATFAEATGSTGTLTFLEPGEVDVTFTYQREMADGEYVDVSNIKNEENEKVTITKTYVNEMNAEIEAEQTTPKMFTDENLIPAWAVEAVEELVDKGILSGRPDGTFDPEGKVTRAEFLTLTVSSLELKLLGPAKPFDDVAANAWYKSVVDIATSKNIVSGVGNNNFAPDNSVSRQDLCVMAYNAITIVDSNLGKIAEGGFSDESAISAYAKEAVYALKTLGIVNGRENGNFDPLATATRAETAIIIKGILDFVRK